MRELTANEIQEVNGGDFEPALALIGAVGGVAAFIGAPAAAAFAAGVCLGGYAIKYMVA